MSTRASIAIFLSFVSWTCVLGQTRAEIELTNGKPLTVYSVSQSIWMSPEYAGDGQVCRMRLYPKPFSGDTNYVGRKELPFDEFQHAIDVLVPVASRGAKKERFESGWNGGGGVMWATFNYDQVTIEYSFGYRLDPDALRKSERVKLDIPVPTPKPGKNDASDDFATFHNSKAEIVTILWNSRKCGS